MKKTHHYLLLVLLLIGCNTLIYSRNISLSNYSIPSYNWSYGIPAIGASPVVYTNYPDPYRSINTNYAIGRTQGNADINQLGAGVYQIPVTLAQGTNNMCPKIAVSYNSQSGNGLLGYGWNMIGTSSIVRVGKSYFYDDKGGDIKLDNTDNLVLDGKRLLLTSGTNLINGTYDTEITDYSLIECTTENSRLVFRIKDRNGLVYEYGTTASSYVQAKSSTAVLYWLLAKVTDQFNNYINYEYETDRTTGEFYLSKIMYTGNSTANVAPNYTVDFIYGIRKDIITYYTAGNPVTQKRVLTGIKNTNNGTILREYKFSYAYDNFYSKLVEVTEFGMNGSRYNSTIIDWGDYSGAYSRNAKEYLSFLSASKEGLFPDFVDINGDGKTDMISYPTKSSYTSSDVAALYLTYTYYGEISFTKKCTLPLISGFAGLTYADLNGDGTTEVIRTHSTGNNSYRFTIFAFNGTGFTNTGKWFDSATAEIMVGDYNGDGKMELLTKSECSIYNDSGIIASGGIDNWGEKDAYCYPNHLFMTDFNGDGKTDVLAMNKNGSWVYTLNGFGFVKLTSFNSTEVKNRMNNYIGDFNGDGKTDILCQNSYDPTDVALFTSTGTNYVKKQILNHDIKARVFVADCNKDGITEIVHGEVIAGNKWKMKVGTFNGDQFINESYISTSIDPSQIRDNPNNVLQSNAEVADFDGDGRAEFLLACFLDANIIYEFGDKQNLLVKGILDGFNKRTTFSYTPITDSGIYSESTSTAVFPVSKIQLPLYVVNSITDYGSGISMSRSYDYKGLSLHRQGKGLLCFGEISKTDYSRGIKTKQTYNYGTDNGYNPYLEKSETYTTSGELLDSQLYTYSFPVVSGKIRKQHLLSKTVDDKVKAIHVAETYVYDQYSLPQGISININNKEVYIAKINLYTHVIKDNIRLLGLPKSISTQTSRSGKDPWIHSTQYTYDSNYRLSKKEVYVENSSNKVSEETFEYNLFGYITVHNTKPYTSGTYQTTTYTYSADGRTLSDMTDPSGFKTSYNTYDPRGLLTKFTDHKNRSTTHSYDNMGNPVVTLSPGFLAEKNDYEWNESIYGSVYAVRKNKVGHPTTLTLFNCFGNELRHSQTQFNGTEIHLDKEYSSKGLLERESIPFGGSSASQWNTYEYDKYDRLLKTTYASGKIDSYTYNGSSISETKNGITTTRNYDGVNELRSCTDPSGTVDHATFSNGKPESIGIGNDLKTTFTYDNYGRQLTVNDPSAGIRQFEYDEYGNIKSETDAEGRKTGYVYNSFGELVSKTVQDQHASVSYNYSYEGHLLRSITGSNNTSTVYTYNEHDKLATVKETAPDNKWLLKTFTYENYRIKNISYQSHGGNITTETYTYQNGHLKSISIGDGTVIWDLQSINNFGYATQIQTGNVTNNYAYNTYGLPTGRTAGSSAGGTFFSSSYNFNPANGNLNSRTDNSRAIAENFTYDNLNRLAGYKNQTISYSPYGNILSKSDAGQMTYNKYAVSSIAPVPDTNTALSKTQEIRYNAFLRPEVIKENAYEATFTYNSDGQRVKMNIRQNNSDYLTRYYVDDCYESDLKAGVNTEKLYLGGDYYHAPAVYIKQNNGAWQLYYIIRDYLGSITHITDKTGKLMHEYSYDAWGRLRNPVNQTVYTSGNEPDLFLGRGYTGHEHLTVFGLINMNARLYDPIPGRFLSADPIIEFSGGTQRLNGYTYGMNNPLSYTDVEGKSPFLIAALIVAGAYIGGVASNQGELNPLKWNYKSVTTYLGIGIGAVVGYYGAYGIINPGTMVFAGNIGTPYVAAGVAVGSLGAGTDWKYNFHWSTAGGGGGGITNSTFNPQKSVDEAIQKAQWDYTAYQYASYSLVLMADDATGIGVLNDPLIPLAYGVATMGFIYMNQELVMKQAREIAHIETRTLTPKQGFTYELRPLVDGYYNNVRGGQVYLTTKDVWKYGETIQGEKRYASNTYEINNFKMHPIFYGNKMEILIQEKIMIYGYYFEHGKLPPGNKIFR